MLLITGFKKPVINLSTFYSRSLMVIYKISIGIINLKNRDRIQLFVISITAAFFIIFLALKCIIYQCYSIYLLFDIFVNRFGQAYQISLRKTTRNDHKTIAQHLISAGHAQYHKVTKQKESKNHIYVPG